MSLPFEPDKIDKIEIRNVPKRVVVTVKEEGSEDLAKYAFRRNAASVPWVSTLNRRTKTLVISVKMHDDDEGTVSIVVPRGYGRRTTIHRR